MLNKIKILLLSFSFCFVNCAFPQYEDVDLRDFVYHAELILNEKKNIFGALSELISESEIKSEIKELRLFNQSGKKISNLHALTDRIENDIQLLYKKAHFFGFYETKIKYKIHFVRPNSLRVKVYVNLGNSFNLKADAEYVGRDEKFRTKYRNIINRRVRTLKASIPEIKNFIACAVLDLKKDGFYNPKILEKKIRLNYEKMEAQLSLKVDPGQNVKFSTTQINAFPGISETFIMNRIEWNEGDIFDIEKVEDTIENLKNTQIFSKIKVKPDEEKEINNKIPMLITLEEDKKRTIDIGLLYSGMRNMGFEKKARTKKRLKSFTTRLSWSNCNTFGGGENLRFIAEGTPMKDKARRADYSFEAFFSKPDTFFKNNTSEYSISRKQELTNVFFKKNDKISVTFDYPLYTDLTLIFGAASEKNYIDSDEIFFSEGKQRKNYSDFLVKSGFMLDRTNDWLNPTSGYRLSAQFARVQLKNSTIGGLNTLDTSFSYNFPVDEIKNNILAFNVSRKSILNGKIDDIPIDKRIYAGGIDSVRGFANQMASEIIKSKDIPMGGKSSIEFNAEYRRKISSDFGAVIFFDGAKIFQNQSVNKLLETERKRWFFSTGVGIRYFTGIGPIRVDFAFPIKKRKETDSRMQFIISLGQAF